MTHSTLLALLLTSPCCQDLLSSPLLQPLASHIQRLVSILLALHQQPLTPQAARDFEIQLQECLRQLGLDLCDWAYNRLEPADPQQMPPRLDAGGERYRRRDRSPNTIATLFGSLTLNRFLYEDLGPEKGSGKRVRPVLYLLDSFKSIKYTLQLALPPSAACAGGPAALASGPNPSTLLSPPLSRLPLTANSA